MAENVRNIPGESYARRFARQLRENAKEAWQGAQYERPIKDKPGVMSDSTPVDPNVMPGYERVNSRGLKDLAEVGFDWALSPALSLATYSPEAEGAPKKVKAPGKTGATTRLLRGETVARPKGDIPAPELSVPPEGGASFVPPTREVAAPRDVDVGKRFKSGGKAGDYRGTEAFGGINPQQLGPMRSQYLRKMETGAPGRLWYDETSDDIFRLTGEVPASADNLANMLAVTSSRTPVGSNAMYGFKGWNQNAVGDPIRTGGFPTAMGKHITEALRSPEASATGLKRSPFSAGLSVNWRGADFANRPTHDIHDVRAWGITDPKTGGPWKKGVGEAGHRFLDEQAEVVTQRAIEKALGGKVDWTPYRAQAAAWIAQKAAKEGIPIEEAAKHYGNFIDDYSALVTREWVPGANTGHLPESLGAPEGVRRGFSEDLEQVVRGPQNIDALAHEMGALSDEVLPNRGVYEGASNPGFTSRIPVGKGTGTHDIDPASGKLVDAIAAGHGLLGTQKQSAWNFLGGPSSISRAGGYRINRGAPYAEDELAQLQQATAGAGADIPMVDPRGARVLEFADEGDAMRKERIKALREAAGPDATVEPMARSGNLFPVDENWNAPEKYSTLPYIEKIEAGGQKVVEGFNRAMSRMAPEVLARTERWAQQQGWTQAPWFKDAMDALSTGGLAKLKELQKAGIVPAAFLVDLEQQQGGG